LSIASRLPSDLPTSGTPPPLQMKTIEVTQTHANFEREKLRFPFGFKGGYLTELWQTASKLESADGHKGIAIATQSAVYGDADLFIESGEAPGNALMYLVTARALQSLRNRKFTSPIGLMDELFPEVYETAKQLTGRPTLNPNFVYNALVSVDNAIWLLYAAE